jgi:trk system potassium uptake protein TrkH
MAAGALPFGLYVRALHGDRRPLLENTQVRAFTLLLLVTGVAFALAAHDDHAIGWLAALRHGLFTTTSIVTTTGFVSTDYQLWGAFAIGLALLLTFVGGCTGSTAGGVKIFRWQILLLQAKASVRQTVQPNRVVPRRYDGRRVTGDVFGSVATFFFLFVLLIAATTLGLMAFGLDLVTALSGAATALANVGPGLGATVGPTGTFASLPDGAKLLLCAAMLLGRLELLTLLVLLDSSFWRG